MTISGLHIVDLAVVLLYFAVVLYIGYRAMRRVRTQEDFFMGGRQFNRFFQTFSQFGQATSSESTVQTVSIVGVNGLAGAVQGACQQMFTYPVAWLFPKWLRRTRYLSMADYFYERFQSRRLAALYAVAQTCMFLMVGGMGLYAMSKTIMAIAEKPVAAYSAAERAQYEQALKLDQLEGRPSDLLTADERTELETLRLKRPQKHFSYVNRLVLIFSIALIVLLYAAGGGLEAAVHTDALQGSFILILTVMLLPFAMLQLNSMHGTEGVVGPFRAIHRLLPQSLFEVFGSPLWVEFTWYNILLIAVISIAGNIAFSNNLVVAGAARTEKVASFGGLGGMLIKGGSTFVWMLLALLLLGIFGEQTHEDPDLLWGMAARTLLPVGLLGLMVACLMAAYMSTASMHMMTVSGLLTNNVYKILRPGRPDGHYVTVGRVLMLVYITGAIVFALRADSIYKMWKFMLLINICCGPAMLMGFLWRRTNRLAVWASMGTALALTLLIPLVVNLSPTARYRPGLLLEVPSPAVAKIYKASAADVERRIAEMGRWDLLQAAGKAVGTRPLPLQRGETFTRVFSPPAKAAFWDGGIKLDREERRYGSGLFKPELYLLHCCGVKLQELRPALVECISLLFRLTFPFLAVLLVGGLTRPAPQATLDFFYGKQRTPVDPDPAADLRAVEETRRQPHRFDAEKRFPHSNWEFGRLPAYDRKGLCVAFGAGLLLVTLIAVLGTVGH